MKLRTKLISVFMLLALITVAVSATAYWQVERLSSAFYEVGVVRLPSLRGLNLMSEALLVLDASERITRAQELPVAVKMAERSRQTESWRRFDEGWAIYEPLPQSKDESRIWQTFVPAAHRSRADFENRISEQSSRLNSTAESANPSIGDGESSFAAPSRILADLIAINYAISEEAKQTSIASREDASRLRAFTLWVGGLGGGSAILIGILFGRLISRPLVKTAHALGRVSAGDLNVQAEVGTDEIGDIARAFNRMLETLRSSEARLQVLSDNLPSSVVFQIAQESDGSMRFLYASARTERLHGFTAEALLRDSSLFYDQVVEQDREKIVLARQRSIADMSPFNLTVQIRRNDGGIRSMYISSAPRRLPDGRIVWDGIETDITERHTDRERLQESETKFKVIFEYSLEAIGVSKGLQITMVNESFLKLFGYASSEEILGASVYDVIAPGSHPILDDRLRRRNLGEQLSPEFEVRGRRKDGTEMELEVQPTTVIINGEHHTIVLHRDITARKRSEAEIRRANRALKTIRECHELLVHATTEPALLQRICETIAKHGGYRAAWVGFVEPLHGLTIHPFTQSGASDDDFNTLSRSWALADHRIGPTATALRTGRPAVSNDFQNDPDVAQWHDVARRYGFNSALVLPLRTEGKTLGALSIYAEETSGFDPGEIDLLSGLADNLAFGIQALRDRQLHERSEVEVHRLLSEAEAGRSALLSILEDQKLAEDALHRSEERFRTAMLNSAIGMALADPDGQCVEVNPALCAIVGYSREELLRLNFQSITHLSDRPADSDHFQRMIKGEVDTYEMEKRYVRKDGSVVWVQLNVSLVRDSVGRPLHSISQIQDITERRTIAATREEILERLRLALKAGHLGTFRRNLCTGEGHWDEQSFLLMGRDPSTGTPDLAEFLTLVHPDDRSSLTASMESALILEKEIFYSFRLIQPDGKLRHFHVHSMIEPAPKGRCEWITGVFSDVSEIVEAQESLKLAAQRLQLALSTSELGVWQYDLQTSEIHWDERMYEIYQRDPSSAPLSDQAFLERIVPEDRESVEHAWQNLLAGRADYRIHYRITTSTGEIRHIEANGVIQYGDDARAKSVIGVNGDITELIKATAESERLREQLQQAQKMETLGTLAAGVAHDFNNLLTGINGFVDLAASSLPPGHEAGDLLKQALRGAMNARDLVRRILDFSRGRGDQAKTRIDLGELVRDSAPLISAALPSHISLSVSVDGPVLPILGDSGQLQQVLMNLCVNGSHAIGAASGTLQIKISAHLFEPNKGLPPPLNCDPGSYVCLSVTDSGCGMDEATRKRIFEPFFTTKRPGVGTGLGLSIIRDIVTSHHGGIGVDTAPGAGTTFSIYLPAMVAADQLPAISPPNGAIHGKGQRILVVDDEPAVAMVLRLSLQKSGFSPEVYTSSTDAWKRFARAPHDFDLLMVDQNMPHLSGREFILQARGVAADLPVIIMSGRFERSERSSHIDTPDVYEMKKPFDITDLVTAVVQSLHRTQPTITNEPIPL